jgi:hypothetical protein
MRRDVKMRTMLVFGRNPFATFTSCHFPNQKLSIIYIDNPIEIRQTFELYGRSAFSESNYRIGAKISSMSEEDATAVSLAHESVHTAIDRIEGDRISLLYENVEANADLLFEDIEP